MSRASFHDPLRPQVKSLAEAIPYYEDRILVRWVPPPPSASTIASPHTPNPRDTGPQHGIVVAVGAGSSGLTKTVRGPEGQPMAKLKPFKNGVRVEPTVKPGDRVLYARVPDCEFMEGPDLYTFLFEEQSILGVLDAVEEAA
jgi:co-chaperonin GroES (HSP10)